MQSQNHAPRREDARDATQEILLKVLTHLATFRGESRFTTWVFRIASNHLQDCRRSRLEAAKVDFAAFAADLDDGLEEHAADSTHDPEQQVLLEEIRIGCTLAMLACLDRSHRLAYILGEIFDMTDTEAAVALQISAAAFRKRLSRARRALGDFMQSKCGIVNPDNRCRCAKRASRAIALGRARCGAAAARFARGRLDDLRQRGLAGAGADGGAPCRCAAVREPRARAGSGSNG